MCIALYITSLLAGSVAPFISDTLLSDSRHLVGRVPGKIVNHGPSLWGKDRVAKAVKVLAKNPAFAFYFHILTISSFKRTKFAPVYREIRPLFTKPAFK
jgi:hypothetical protein